MGALLQHPLILRQIPMIAVVEYATLVLLLAVTCKPPVQFSKANVTASSIHHHCRVLLDLPQQGRLDVLLCQLEMDRRSKGQAL